MTPEDPNYRGPDISASAPERAEHGPGQLSVVPDHGAPAPAAPPVASAWLEEPEAGEGLKLTTLLHSLRRRWLVATGVGLGIVVVLAPLLWLLIPTEYEAVAYLRVHRDVEDILGNKNIRGTDKAYEIYKQTQRNLIKGPFVITDALRRPGITQVPMVQRESNPVEWLMDELTVNVAPDSEMIEVRLKGPDPDQPVRIVNAVLVAYQELIVDREASEQADMLDTLKKTFISKTEEYERKTRDFRDLAKESLAVDDESAKLNQRVLLNDLVDLGRKRDQLERQLSDSMRKSHMIRAAVDAGRTKPDTFLIEDLLERDYEYYEMKRMIDDMERRYQYYAGIVGQGSSALMRMAGQLRQANYDLEKLREEKEPRIIAQIKRMQGTDDQSVEAVVRPLNAEIASLNAELKAVIQKYDEQRAEFETLSKASAELLIASKEVEMLEEFLKNTQLEMNTLEVNLRRPDRVMVLQKAIVPESSNILTKSIQVGGACLLIFLGTIAGVALWDYQGKRVNTTKDVDAPAVGLRVVGSLPLLDGHSGVRLWPFSRMDERSLEVVLNFSVDSIRAALLYNRSKDKIKVVMITSAQGREGRSTVASQLAVSLARSGRRTLLIDADIRNPQQQFVFGVRGDRGLCELLRRETPAEHAVEPTSVEHLWVMPAGRFSQSSMQALSGDTARAVFDELRAQYDFVIIDVGPVLTSADPLLLGQHVDSTLISVLRDVSQIPKIYAACDRLRSVGIHVMGAVVNGTGTEIRATELKVATTAAALPDPNMEPSVS